MATLNTPQDGIDRAQRFLSRELGEKGIAEYYSEPDKIAQTVLGLGRQRAWEAYEEATPNLSEVEVRRVGRHIGFDEAWDLFAPLLEAQIARANEAEDRLDFLGQYRDMLRESGDSPWDPQLVATDLTHVLELDASELPGRDAELEPRIAAAPQDAPKRLSRREQIAAAVQQVEDDAERGLATAQWVRDLAATYDGPLGVIPAQEGFGSSTQGLQRALDLSALSYDGAVAPTAEVLEKYSDGFASLYAALDQELLSIEPGPDTSYEFKRGFFAARTIIEIKMAAKKMAEGEPDFEYGWRSFFDSGEEYEWLACYDRDEAESLIKRYQAEEDEGNGHDPETDTRRFGSRLTYSLWKRVKSNPGPWIAVDSTEDSD